MTSHWAAIEPLATFLTHYKQELTGHWDNFSQKTNISHTEGEVDS